MAFGMPVGPIELADNVGLDVVLHVSGVLGAKMDGPVPEKLRGMVEAGTLGRKNGQGILRVAGWQGAQAAPRPVNDS